MGNINKLKIFQIKQNASNDKNMKNTYGIKSKLLKAELINNDKIIPKQNLIIINYKNYY